MPLLSTSPPFLQPSGSVALPFPMREGLTLLTRKQNGSETNSRDLLAPMLQKKEGREREGGRGKDKGLPLLLSIAEWSWIF